MNRPAVWTALLWLSGLAVGGSGHAPAWAAPAALLAAWRAPLLAVFLVGMTLAGWTLQRRAHDPLQGWDGREVTLTGVVAEPPTPHRALVEGTVQGQPVRLLVLCDQPLDWCDSVTVRGRLEPLPAPRNPGEPDLRLREQRRAVHHRLQASHVTLHGCAAPWPLRPLVLARKRLREGMSTLVGPPYDGLLCGIVLGDAAGLPEDWQSAFRASGTSHILVASGTNMMVVTTLGMRLLAVLRVSWSGQCGLGMAMAVVYAALAGASWATLRAAFCAVLLQVAHLSGDRYDRFNAVALAAVVLSVWDPLCPLDVGWQLSFAAVLGLSVVTPWLEARMPSRPAGLGAALAVVLGAWIGVLPVQLLIFDTVSLVGVAANLVVVPLAEVALVLGLPLGLLSAAGLVLAGTGAVLRGLLVALVAAATWFGQVPPWQPPPLPRPATNFQLWCLDVGHGDALLLRWPGGRDWLVDGGPQSSPRLGPALRAIGVWRLERVVVTHAHEDHYGGLVRIRDRVHRLTCGPDRELPLDVPAELWARGSTMATPGGRLRVLHPEVQDRHRGNDASLVLRLEYGMHSFLLAGDAEAAAEGDLLRREAHALHSTVLKVGHHGSSTSSTQAFVEAVRPQVALVSVGRRFRGLPDAAVLRRLAHIGAAVYRTDRQGAICVESDGHRLRVRSMLRD